MSQQPTTQQFRQAGRFLKSIVLRGNPAPCELSLSILMLITGIAIFFTPNVEYVSDPVWPLAHVFIGSVGMIGLAFRITIMRAAFGFMFFQVRLWTGWEVFTLVPANTFWIGAFIGAAMGIWIMLRHWCLLTQRLTRKNRRCKEVKRLYNGESDRRLRKERRALERRGGYKRRGLCSFLNNLWI